MTCHNYDRNKFIKIPVFFIEEVESVLDIGCGIHPQSYIAPEMHICCEPCDEYVGILKEKLSNSGRHTTIQGKGLDVLKTFPDRGVDSIFLLDVIEHFEKEDGIRLIAECERVARRQIIIFTPIGYLPQEYDEGDADAWGLHGSSWQIHKSGWVTDDFDASWDFITCNDFHLCDVKGKLFDPPFGAMWAIKTFPDANVPIGYPLVTVITPIMDGEIADEEMLRSVKAQIYPFIEHLIIDCRSDVNENDIEAEYGANLKVCKCAGMDEAQALKNSSSEVHGDIIIIIKPGQILRAGAVSYAVQSMKTDTNIKGIAFGWKYDDDRIANDEICTGIVDLFVAHLEGKVPPLFVRNEIFQQLVESTNNTTALWLIELLSDERRYGKVVQNAVPQMLLVSNQWEGRSARDIVEHITSMASTLPKGRELSEAISDEYFYIGEFLQNRGNKEAGYLYWKSICRTPNRYVKSLHHRLYKMLIKISAKSGPFYWILLNMGKIYKEYLERNKRDNLSNRERI